MYALLKLNFRFCLKLHAKSAAAYKMLQQVLVIPSERRLRHERSKLQRNEIGMQKLVVERIKNALVHARKECDRMTILAFDEMTIKGMSYFCVYKEMGMNHRNFV